MSPEGVLHMEVSASLLRLGLALTGLGIILLLLSLRRRYESESIEFSASGVVFIGPIPIILGGRYKWAVIGIAVFVVIILYATAMAAPPPLG